MKIYYFLTCLVALCAQSVYGKNENGHCVWYGRFKQAPTYNKVSNEPAQPLINETAAALLKRICPLLFVDVNPGELIKTCCDAEQIADLSKRISIADPIFGRCPTCKENVIQHACKMTCAPDQSKFMKVTKTTGEKIESVEVYISEEYTNATYESCKNVIYPAIGIGAVQFLCSGDGCTAKKMFQTFGAQSFFPMTYVYDKKDFVGPPLNPPTKKCNEAYDGLLACSSVDCIVSSDPEYAPANTKDFEIFGLNGYGFLSGLAILMSSTFFTVLYVIFDRKQDVTETASSESIVSNGNSNANTESSERFTSGEKLCRFLESLFVINGKFFAKHPVSSLAIICIFVLIMSNGISKLRITANPIEIWSAPDSRARMEKDYFDKHFQPFYRTQQIYIKPVHLKEFTYYMGNRKKNVTFSPVFHKEILSTVYKLQEEILQIKVDETESEENAKKNISFNEICYAPIKGDSIESTTIDDCLVQSVLGYLAGDISDLGESVIKNKSAIANHLFNTNYNETLSKMHLCLSNPYNSYDCLAPYKGLILPEIALGGFLQQGKQNYGVDDYLKSKGLILTFLIRAPHGKKTLNAVKSWEKKFLDFMKNWTENEKPVFMDVAYSAERSIEDELERTSKAEATTVFYSYALMVVYIAIALGDFQFSSKVFVSSKIFLSISGIIIILISVSCTVGFYGYFNVPTSLLTIEVIPFLTLAVGVDNIFLLTRAHQRYPRRKEETIPDHIGRILGLVGPSLLLSSTSQVACFLIGSTFEMPAVKTFAQFAAVSILINFLLQVTAFVCLLSLDARRQEKNYLDCFCCFSLKKPVETKIYPGVISTFFEQHYTPFIMLNSVRKIVLITFVAGLTLSTTIFIPKMEIGLDQSISMPDDSYVYKYFTFMQDLLSMGPPVYFVVKEGLDYSQPEVQKAITGLPGHNNHSLYMQIFAASNRPNESFIAKPANSWLDDYADWSRLEYCCRSKNGSFCYRDPSVNPDICDRCNITTKNLRPVPESFRKYISFFMQDIPDQNCGKGGRAGYTDAVRYYNNSDGSYTVGDTYFATFHTPLKTSSDWYEALRSARELSNNITRMINGANLTNKEITVFPYSVFYVFYEQYLNIGIRSLLLLSLSLLSVFLVTFCLTGFSFFSAFIVLLTVSMIMINLGGFMTLFDISLNGVSLVNLVMAVGISVEFCSHTVHAYLISNRSTRINKAADSLIKTGSSVFSGITLTKFVGIVVLGFANTKIFTIFFFKMYFAIILLGAVHGLLFLPVLLSYIGPLKISKDR